MSIFRCYHDDKELMDWLNVVIPIESKITPEQMYYTSSLSFIEMIKSGTTTVCDMYFYMNKIAQAVQDTGIRAVLAWSVTDDSIRDKYEKTIQYCDMYNTSDSRIKINISLHAGYTCNPETIKRFVQLAKELNVGLQVHLAETIAEEEIIKKRYNKTPTEYLKETGILDLPIVLAHGIYLSDTDIELLKKIKGGISHNPISNCKLASGICDVTKLRQNNINVGLGTDGAGSTTTLDMFEEMRTAAYLQKIKYKKSSIISAYDILKMATIEGAKVLGLDHEIGTVEENKKADLILVNLNKTHFNPLNDISTNLVYAANGSDIDTVIIDGNIVMENRCIKTIDEKQIVEKSRKIAKEVLE